MPLRAPSLLALVVTGALACGTASGPVQIRARPSAPAADAYAEILDAHTRRAHIYDWLADRVDVRATYLSPAYRQAYQAARQGFHGKAAERIDEILGMRARVADPIEGFADVIRPFSASPTVEHDLADSESFFVAFYAADQSYRTIHDDSTIWDTTLSVDGRPGVKPFKFERLRRTPSLDQVYPYLDKLDLAYVLYFPKSVDGRPLIPADARSLELRIVSKHADARLRWELVR
jgi:hypothetical protein